MSNLLVIDWDYFFPNPMDGGEYKTEVVDGKGREGNPTLLYDWGHHESPLMIEHIWPTRAQGFLMNNLPLPEVNDEWKTFAQRFQFDLDEDTYTYFAESNMEAGNLSSPYGESFEHIYLYDAHHDSGYKYKTMAEFRAAQRFSCEDWMLMHADRGSELHVRYPTWKTYWKTAETPPPVDLVIDRAMDDGLDPGVVFDSVFLCRSGAWVPSWEDAKFFQFLDTLPGDEVEELGQYPVLPRKFDLDKVREEMLMMRAAMKALAKAAKKE